MNELIRFGEALFPYLVDAVWQGTALMVIFFVLARFFRRRHLTARYWLWVYCLVGILLLPGISFFAGDHRLALLPAKEHIAVTRPASSPGAPVSPVADSIPMTELTDTVSPSEEAGTPAPAEEPFGERPPSEIVAPKGVAETSTADSGHKGQPIVSAPISEAASPFPWRGCVALAWMAGCTAFLLRLLFAMVCVIRLRRSARPVEDSLVAESFEEVKRNAGIRGRVALRIGRRVSSPVSIGILRPTILLPESLVKEMPPEQLRPILLHELAHIRWGDYAVNLLQRLAQAIFFFHPLMYWVNRTLRGLREEICDGWVLSHCPQATLYARALTTLAERWLRPRRSLLGVGLFNHHSRLSERIKRILGSGGRVPTAIRLRTALLLLAVSLCAVAALSLTTFSAKAAKEGEKSTPPKKEATEAVEEVADEHAVSWKDDTVYRGGDAYAKIVQWEPEADLPMTAFGDRNDNGETDTWIRFLNGKPLRIEIDSNEDGRIDRWEHYFDGVIDLVEQDTDFNRRVDIWEVYDNGKLFRKEIDENADGSVDRWLEVDEQGKLVEKEIFSWTAPAGGLGSIEIGSAVAFFNARDRVAEVEVEQEEGNVSPEEPESPGRDRASAPEESVLRYWASTGSRIEFAKEVEGGKVISGWYHMGVPGTDPPGTIGSASRGRRLRYVSPAARYSAEDRGLDGGVDTWKEIGPLVSETGETGEPREKPLYTVTCDDRNRDGRADRWEILHRPDAALWPLQALIETADTNADGLSDFYSSHSLGFIVDVDHDGEFDSFPREWSVPFRAEPVGSGILRLKLEVAGAEEPHRFLCELRRKPESSYYCNRVFWAFAGETVDVMKLRYGTYTLQVSAILPEGLMHFESRRASNSLNYRTARFFYPDFVSIGKSETVSQTLAFDARPVFRGRLISNDILPVERRKVTISQPGQWPERVEVWSDDWGDFELFNLPPGVYVLASSGLERKIRVLGQGAEPPQRLAIAVPVEMATIPPRKAPPVPEGWKAPLALYGRVLSHEGEPLSNMKVVVTPPAAGASAEERVTRRPPVPIPGGSKEERTIRREVITGLDGSYRILALPPAPYEVSIYNNDFENMQPVEKLTIEIEKTPMEKDFRLSGPMMPREER